jgi:5-(carboxyamino)imidazole ribonucleotide mutase
MKKKILPIVGIIMGSETDWKTMEEASLTLKKFGIPHEIEVVSAHRTPDRMVEYAREAQARGLKVLIAGAGGAAHLPGMVASLTILPVIGVPVVTKNLQGLDSLLSIVQMPKGIPVATVAIGNSANAALLALRMLAIGDAKLNKVLLGEEIDLKIKVKDMNKRIKKVVSK